MRHGSALITRFPYPGRLEWLGVRRIGESPCSGCETGLPSRPFAFRSATAFTPRFAPLRGHGITTARALRRAAASRHDPYANGFTASRMRSACCLRGSGTSAPAPLRQHARAYAYRGLRALASLSMARSGRRGPVRVVPEAIAETGLRLVGDPYGFVLARPPRDCRQGSSNQGRPTRLAICDFPQNPFLYAGSSNSDDQEPRLSVGPHRHRHQAPSPGASPQTAP